MTWPILETLDRIAPFVPGALVSPATLEQIGGQARRMPGVWSSYYIECRLGADEQQVDFLASVGAQAREALGTSTQSIPLDHSTWQPWLRLCSEWMDPRSVLYSQVPALWVELDHVDRPSESAANVCVCVSQNYHRRRSLKADRDGGLEAFYRAIEVLAPGGIGGDELACVQRAVATLGPGGELIHLSLMLGRAPVVLKLYVSVPVARWRAYLAELVPSADLHDLFALLSRIDVPTDPVFLDLTIEASFSRRIGFAFSQVHRVGSDPSWPRLLDACVDRGVASADKREGLRHWVGSERLQYSGEAWPVHLHRYLDVKLVSTPDRPLQAKAYLGFQPRAGLL